MKIRECGMKAGLAIRPATTLEVVTHLLAHIDLLLVMTVEPGFGGQEIILACLDKVREAKVLHSKLMVQVDGGVNLNNVKQVKEAGADIIVAGTAIFEAENPSEVIKKLRC